MTNGWVAECQTCPTTIGGYGERIYVHQEFSSSGEREAELWAFLHRDMHRGHRVTVKQFAHIKFTAVDIINPQVLNTLFGNLKEE